ncbi:MULTISPECIES: hypothetical protein [unclassified Mesorhizobium]|uniref:hypothetical protein n=1 Tax=unclassified Mesorhizobium TaxID=325217 RepID=UPI0016774686|nr:MULTISPECIES: hypothetical protein [unclassified Mesorhizobium]
MFIVTRLTDAEIVSNFEEVAMDFREVLRIVRWMAAKCDQRAAGEEAADRMLDALGRVRDVVTEAIGRPSA